ncbi:unnamed protein product [Laminaria digitata]
MTRSAKTVVMKNEDLGHDISGTTGTELAIRTYSYVVLVVSTIHSSMTTCNACHAIVPDTTYEQYDIKHISYTMPYSYQSVRNATTHSLTTYRLRHPAHNTFN